MPAVQRLPASGIATMVEAPAQLISYGQHVATVELLWIMLGDDLKPSKAVIASEFDVAVRGPNSSALQCFFFDAVSSTPGETIASRPAQLPLAVVVKTAAPLPARPAQPIPKEILEAETDSDATESDSDDEPPGKTPAPSTIKGVALPPPARAVPKAWQRLNSSSAMATPTSVFPRNAHVAALQESCATLLWCLVEACRGLVVLDPGVPKTEPIYPDTSLSFTAPWVGDAPIISGVRLPAIAGVLLREGHVYDYPLATSEISRGLSLGVITIRKPVAPSGMPPQLWAKASSVLTLNTARKAFSLPKLDSKVFLFDPATGTPLTKASVRAKQMSRAASGREGVPGGDGVVANLHEYTDDLSAFTFDFSNDYDDMFLLPEGSSDEDEAPLAPRKPPTAGRPPPGDNGAAAGALAAATEGSINGGPREEEEEGDGEEEDGWKLDKSRSAQNAAQLLRQAQTMKEGGKSKSPKAGGKGKPVRSPKAGDKHHPFHGGDKSAAEGAQRGKQGGGHAKAKDGEGAPSKAYAMLRTISMGARGILARAGGRGGSSGDSSSCEDSSDFGEEEEPGEAVAVEGEEEEVAPPVALAQTIRSDDSNKAHSVTAGTKFTAMSLMGRPMVGRTLVAAGTLPKGLTKCLFQWHRLSKEHAFRVVVKIPGAITPSYVITHEDLGCRLLVTVSPLLETGEVGKASIAVSGEVRPAPPGASIPYAVAAAMPHTAAHSEPASAAAGGSTSPTQKGIRPASEVFTGADASNSSGASSPHARGRLAAHLPSDMAAPAAALAPTPALTSHASLPARGRHPHDFSPIAAGGSMVVRHNMDVGGGATPDMYGGGGRHTGADASPIEWRDGGVAGSSSRYSPAQPGVWSPPVDVTVDGSQLGGPPQGYRQGAPGAGGMWPRGASPEGPLWEGPGRDRGGAGGDHRRGNTRGGGMGGWPVRGGPGGVWGQGRHVLPGCSRGEVLSGCRVSGRVRGWVSWGRGHGDGVPRWWGRWAGSFRDGAPSPPPAPRLGGGEASSSRGRDPTMGCAGWSVRVRPWGPSRGSAVQGPACAAAECLGVVCRPGRMGSCARGAVPSVGLWGRFPVRIASPSAVRWEQLPRPIWKPSRRRRRKRRHRVLPRVAHGAVAVLLIRAAAAQGPWRAPQPQLHVA
eukprot:jgi/Mesvir1/19572/Mv09876-RA.1